MESTTGFDFFLYNQINHSVLPVTNCTYPYLCIHTPHTDTLPDSLYCSYFHRFILYHLVKVTPIKMRAIMTFPSLTKRSRRVCTMFHLCPCLNPTSQTMTSLQVTVAVLSMTFQQTRLIQEHPTIYMTSHVGFSSKCSAGNVTATKVSMMSHRPNLVQWLM